MPPEKITLPEADVAAFARLLEIVRELRERCPWDREQTVVSLAAHLVEEAYETADAIERSGNAAVADELGDLLSQVLFVAVIAGQEQRFEFASMLTAAADKLVRRHPHVYGPVKADTSEQVVENWERIKRSEREDAGAQSALDGVARGLPALMRAEKLGQRARSAGMDWADLRAVLAKVREEIHEVEAALARNDHEAVAEELGDTLLALANAPRFVGHHAEDTLKRACDKFIGRFTEVERILAERKLELNRLTANEVEGLWQEAKQATANRRY